jgi:hypothetical protein
MKRRDIWVVIALFLPSAIVLSLHGYLGLYNRYLADDYCYAYIAKRFNVFRAVWYWYRSWEGVFGAVTTDQLLVVVDPYKVKYALSVVLVLWVAATALAVHFLLEDRLIGKKNFVVPLSLGASIVFVILAISPDVRQSVYWWVGMVKYSSPLIFLTIYVDVYLWMKRKKWTFKYYPAIYLFSFLALLYLSGFSETLTPALIMLVVYIILLGMSIGNIKFRDREFNFLLAGLVGACLGLIIMLLAPGNAERRAELPPAPSLAMILTISLDGFISHLSQIFFTLDKLLALLGITLGTVWLGFQLRNSPYVVDSNINSITSGSNKNARKAWLALFIGISGFVFAFACFPPGAFGLAEPPPARALVVASLFLVASMAISGFIFGDWLSHQFTPTNNNYIAPFLFLTVALLMGFSAKIQASRLYDTRSEFIEYANWWDTTDAKILEARSSGLEEITVSVKDNWAGLLVLNDNPKFWVNICYTNYYHIQVFGAPEAP